MENLSPRCLCVWVCVCCYNAFVVKLMFSKRDIQMHRIESSESDTPDVEITDEGERIADQREKLEFSISATKKIAYPCG